MSKAQNIGKYLFCFPRLWWRDRCFLNAEYVGVVLPQSVQVWVNVFGKWADST